MSTTNRRVVVLGNAFLDTVLLLPALPTQPMKSRVLDVRRTGGGIAATAATAIARLGGNVSLWSRLGRDETGNEIIARLEELGVEVAGVRRTEGGQSPIGTILVSPDGERMAFGFIGRNLGEDADWLPLETLDGAGAVMADYSWTEGAQAIFTAARERGIVSVLDADVGDLASVEALLALPDHIVFSAACLAALAGTTDAAEALRTVQDRCQGVVSVTQGEKGFVWLENGRVRHVPAFPITAIDTNGAGDVFHGAYTLALGEKMDVEQAARFASAAAALKCAQGSGWHSIPSRDEVEAFIEESGQ